MSTAGAHALRFDCSPVRSKASWNRRLIWSCRVVTPRKGSHRAIVLMVVSTSIGDCERIIKYEWHIVKYDLRIADRLAKLSVMNMIDSLMAAVLIALPAEPLAFRAFSRR